MDGSPTAKLPTLRDVAERAGVSYQTVSRVINEQPHVASETRARVLKVIEELNYRPNRAAQLLNVGRSYILQMIIFEYGYDLAAVAMLHWARQLGYTMIVTELQGAQSEQGILETLGETAHMVDGVLIVLPRVRLSYEALRCKHHVDLPFVVVSTELGMKMPSVVFDQRLGARQALDHLLDLGHCDIAEIRGPEENIDAHIRHQTFEAVMHEKGLAPGPSVMGDFSVKSGYRAAGKLLKSNRKFTALFVANDRMAFGAIRALRESKIEVPKGVSVVGFDDAEAAGYFEPPLTTVRQDFEALGKQSVEYLVSMIEDPDTPIQQRVLYPELVVRQSTRRLTRFGE